MKRVKYEWQYRNYVLKCFGNKEKEAVKSYREFVKGGMSEEKRPDLVGGGLIRSAGGWSEVVSMRRQGERRLADERILGSGDFVKEILEDADKRVKEQFTPDERNDKIRDVINEICKKRPDTEIVMEIILLELFSLAMI